MTVLAALSAAALLLLLIGVPTLVAYRDVRSGRRDPGLPDDGH